METQGNTRSSRVQSLLDRAIAGDRPALIAACRQLKAPILAAIIHAGASWDDASSFVEPTLRRFAKRVLEGHVATHDWRAELTRHVEAVVQMSSEPQADGLTGLGAIPRLAKRRAVRQAMRELSLTELTAVILRRTENANVDEMVGVVADSRDDVVEILAAAQAKLVAAMLNANGECAT